MDYNEAWKEYCDTYDILLEQDIVIEIADLHEEYDRFEELTWEEILDEEPGSKIST